MSDGPLTILPYIWLTVDGLLTAALFALSVAIRIRRPFMLVGAVAMALLALWFASLAVTAGPAPMIKRGEVADALRVLALLAGIAWTLWLLLYARSLIVIERRD